MERPGKIVCVGRNYREHAKELGNDVPAEPMLFFKPPSCVIASGAAIELPADAGRVDFEGEVGVVIGARLTKASEAQCAAAVRGIVAANDVSARDWQKKDGQWARAKGADTFLPLGEESRKPHDLAAARGRHARERRGAPAGVDRGTRVPDPRAPVVHFAIYYAVSERSRPDRNAGRRGAACSERRSGG